MLERVEVASGGVLSREGPRGGGLSWGIQTPPEAKIYNFPGGGPGSGLRGSSERAGSLDPPKKEGADSLGGLDPPQRGRALLGGFTARNFQGFFPPGFLAVRKIPQQTNILRNFEDC